MKKFPKILKSIALSLLVIVPVGLLSVVLALFLYPQIIVNSVTLGLGIEMAEKFGYQINYRVLETEVTSQSWNVKKVSLRANELQVMAPGIKFSSEVLTLEVVADLIRWSQPLREIGPVILETSALSIKELDEADPDEEESSEWNLIEMLDGIKINPLRIKKFAWSSEDRAGKLTKAIVDLDLTKSGDGLAFQGQLTGLQGAPLKSLAVSGSLTKFRPDQLPEFNFNLKASLMPHGSLKLQGSLVHEDETNRKFLDGAMNGKLQVDFRQGSQKLSGEMVGLVDEKRNFVIHPKIELSNPIESLRRLSVGPCELNGSLPPPESGALLINIAGCRLNVARQDIMGEEDQIIGLPRSVRLKLDGTYKIDFNEGWDRVVSKTTLELEPVKTELYALTGKASVEVDGRWSALDQGKFSIDLDSKVEAKKFTNVVKHLETTDWSIPAPLNSLEGQLVCDLSGRLNLTEESLALPMDCETNLRGSDQAMVTRGKGKFTLKPVKGGLQPFLNFDLLLKEIKVQLPNVKLTEGVPTFKGDPRFRDEIDFSTPKKKTDKKKKQTFPLNYKITVRTSKPILIGTQETVEAIPIGVDLLAQSGKNMTGDIKVGTVAIRVIKKEVTLRHFHVALQEFGSPKIDGLMALKRNDFDVLVAVYGTAEKPRYKVYNDPPQPGGNPMASLMYGDSVGDLDGDRKRSLGETQAAMADGAIGIVSMFYLASTPVESVGYNPHSGIFHASVQVRQGVSLSVGSNSEGQRQLGLTKRLFGNWSVATYAVKPSPDESSRGIAMLRWAKRY